MFDSDEDLRNHYRVLLAFFRARLSVHHRKAAEDLAQDTLMAALQRFRQPNHGPITNLPGYLLGIARHKLQDFIDNAQRQPPIVSMDGFLDPGSADSLAEIISNHRDEETERLRDVAGALRSLSEAERELLTLRYVDRLSNAAAAERLGLDPDEASRIKYRVIEKIRRRINGERGRRP
jgi:RNA polymerase sigma factor (sigma-70 family)